MATTLHPILQALRERIEKRSEATRAAYLNSLPQGPQNRTAVGCANLAHVTAHRARYPFQTKSRHLAAPELAVDRGAVLGVCDDGPDREVFRERLLQRVAIRIDADNRASDHQPVIVELR